ncbi:MAG: hypothetical protein Q9172_005497 [Xanthocarpia lactea]
MAPQGNTAPTSTTNVIMGVTLSFGIVALVLGVFFIYKAYMRSLKHQQNDNPQTLPKIQLRKSVMRPRERALPRDGRPVSGQRHLGFRSNRQFRRHGQYPGQGQSNRQGGFDPERDSYPTQLPNVAVPRRYGAYGE